MERRLLRQCQQHQRFGYTAGFGLEWAFRNNWSLRAEYDHIGLRNRTYTVAPGPTIFGGDVITYNYPGFSIMTLAVNYKFGGGVMFDTVIIILVRNGSGVGLSAPQNGPRIGFFVGVSKKF